MASEKNDIPDLDNKMTQLRHSMESEQDFQMRLRRLECILQYESECYIDASHEIGQLGEGMRELPHAPESAHGIETGSIVLQILFALYGLGRASSQFLQGETVSLTDTAKLIYAGTCLALIALAIALPQLALILGAILASTGFLLSTYYLKTHLKSFFRLSDIETQCHLEQARLKQALDEDIATLNQLLHEEFPNKEASLIKLERNINERSAAYHKINLLTERTHYLSPKLNKSLLFRSTAMLLASISLAAAITSFLVPPVGAILMIISFSLGTCWLAIVLGHYAKYAWKERYAPGSTPVQTEVNSSETSSVEEEVREEIRAHDPIVSLTNHPAPSGRVESSEEHDEKKGPVSSVLDLNDQQKVKVSGKEKIEEDGEGEGDNPTPPVI